RFAYPQPPRYRDVTHWRHTTSAESRGISGRADRRFRQPSGRVPESAPGPRLIRATTKESRFAPFFEKTLAQPGDAGRLFIPAFPGSPYSRGPVTWGERASELRRRGKSR